MALESRQGLFAFFMLLCLSILSRPASACPDDQYEQCVFNACVCLPKVGGDLGRGAEHLKNELRGQAGGPALEAWLVGSRNSAIGTSQPIPQNIREALTGYIDDDAMNRARFKIGDNGILNLAGLTIAYGDHLTGRQAAAVTLIDVIVFRDTDDAYNNAALWAHELTHVQQFRDWGTRDFSIRYARNSDSVEDPAYEVERNYPGWSDTHGVAALPSSPQWPAPVRGGLPSGYGMQMCGCWGFNPAPTAPEPRCQSGGVRINACAGLCNGGGSPYAYVCL